MRHNRRAVMAEHYKLYLKKNIFNGRYFVRNVQIVFCALIVFALLFTVVALSGSDNKTKKTAGANKKISVKEALFGNNEVTEAEITASTEAVVAVSEEVVTEEMTTEMATETEEPVSEVVATASNNVEEKTTEEVVESTPSIFDDRCIANVDETLNVRKEPSAEGEFVGSMSKGSIAIVEGKEGEWTKIKSGDVEGYVLTEYILTGKVAEAFAKDYVTIQGTAKEDGINIRKERSVESDILKVLDKGDTVSVIEDSQEDADNTEKATGNTTEEVAKNSTENNTEETTENTVENVTEETTENTEDSTEQVTESTVADSTEESTENSTSEMIETATEGTVENTTEQAVEEKTESTSEVAEKAEEKTAQKDIDWLTVMLDDGQVGYVAKDYIEVDELYTLAVSAEELQRREEERLAAERAAAEAAAEAERLAQQQAAEAARATQTASNTTSSDKGSSSYQGEKTTPVTATESGESLGKFYITAYCGCKKCSGGHNKTASGTTPTQGRTIAADTSVLPFGTQVVIDGVVYTVEDRGSGVCGNHIDIFFATHEDALAFGSKTVTVYKY